MLRFPAKPWRNRQQRPAQPCRSSPNSPPTSGAPECSSVKLCTTRRVRPSANINDLIFDRQGRISTVVIGVGGFLGMGEKNVGVSFDSLTFKVGNNGERMIVVGVSKEALVKAPEFNAIEKSTFERVKDKAADLSHKAVDKAIDLKDQATQKIEDMRKGNSQKQ